MVLKEPNLKKFFKDNSINTSEEFDYWNDVTKYAKNATEAMNSVYRSQNDKR